MSKHSSSFGPETIPVINMVDFIPVEDRESQSPTINTNSLVAELFDKTSAQQTVLSVESRGGVTYFAGGFVAGQEALASTYDPDTGVTQRLEGVLQLGYFITLTESTPPLRIETLLGISTTTYQMDNGMNVPMIIVKRLNSGLNPEDETAAEYPTLDEEGRLLYNFRLTDGNVATVAHEPWTGNVSVGYMGNGDATLITPVENAAGKLTNTDWFMSPESVRGIVGTVRQEVEGRKKAAILEESLDLESTVAVDMSKMSDLSATVVMSALTDTVIQRSPEYAGVGGGHVIGNQLIMGEVPVSLVDMPIPVAALPRARHAKEVPLEVNDLSETLVEDPSDDRPTEEIERQDGDDNDEPPYQPPRRSSGRGDSRPSGRSGRRGGPSTGLGARLNGLAQGGNGRRGRNNMAVNLVRGALNFVLGSPTSPSVAVGYQRGRHQW